MRLLSSCLITGLSVIPSFAAPTTDSNPPWFPSVMAFEHYDSGRSKLFPEAKFTGSFNRDNVVGVRVSPSDYLTPYNVVHLSADMMFLYGGGSGDKGGTGSFVAGVDSSTLSMVWSNQLINTVETGDWDYPGVLSLMNDGYLYVIYGYHLAKLNPQDGSLVLPPLTLPSLAAPSDTSYNGFDALPDGTLIAKTVYRAAGCTNQGFSAFLKCTNAADVTNSLIVAIDPKTLQIIATNEAKEFTAGRITCVQFAGKNYIYLPGSTNIYRYLFENQQLSLDPSWGPVPYRDLDSGQNPASSVAVLNDWIVFADNGTPVSAQTTGSSPWMVMMAINQTDASKNFKVQPFKHIPSPPGFPLSFSPSAVTVDPLHNRIYGLDAGPGVVGALELRPDGLHTVWIEQQRTAEFLTLIDSPQRRVLVGTDVPPGQFPGNNTLDRVVWREAETGRELARSPLLPAVVTGTIVEPGYDGRMYYFTTNSQLLELTVRPSLRPRPVADLENITSLAADAFIWGYGPQYIYRASQYNTIIGAPFNSFKYGAVPAAWNNEASPAGDASVLYNNAFVNLATNDLVLTVPPSRNQYYVVAYYDGYANTVGSIGTRTTPSDVTTNYLLVGPNSPYASRKTARIHGYDYPVMASDTDLNFILIRILANTLIDSSDPTSVPSVTTNVVQKFALNTLQEFELNRHQPLYPTNFITPPPDGTQITNAAPYLNLPTNAVDFFNQLGTTIVINPIPDRRTALSGTALTNLPPWVAPQYGATNTYFVPSYGQQATLDSFAPLGLTEKGFSVPADWRDPQLQALQDGFELGQQLLEGFISSTGGDSNTCYWGIVNDIVGTYPNDVLGYFYRSLIVVEGGVANVALDAVYPTLAGNPGPLQGDSTYKLTFMPPTPNAPLPVNGIYPPMVTNSSGYPKGFWSIHVYSTDSTDANAPFIAQTSLLNRSYSRADTAVVSVDTVSHFMTVNAPDWGTLVASTPILFGDDAADYGLATNTVYYVANTPTNNPDGTFTFQISSQWVQQLSLGHVPIQNSGQAGSIVNLLSPGGPVTLKYGMVKPVTQLGSAQLAANQMATNADGSLTLWFGPSLPANAPASNWIPTPNIAYYSTIYTNAVTNLFQLTLRMYYPTPGDQPPSILPCPDCGPRPLHESYIPPAVEMVE